MNDAGGLSLLDLFREEVRAHTATLGQGLLDLEAGPAEAARLEPLMRAAHSLKGAARIVGIDLAVEVAHALEDVFVAAQAGRVAVGPDQVDLLLQATDLLTGLGQVQEDTLADWTARHEAVVPDVKARLLALIPGTHAGPPADGAAAAPAPAPAAAPPPPADETPAPAVEQEPPEEEAAADDPLLALFREEVAAQADTIDQGLRALAEDPGNRSWLDTLRHAVHAVRSAATIVGAGPAALLARDAEDVLAAAQDGRVSVGAAELEILRQALQDLGRFGQPGDPGGDAAAVRARLSALLPGAEAPPRAPAQPPVPAGGPSEERAVVPARPAAAVVAVARVDKPAPAETVPAPAAAAPPPGEAVVRVTAQSLNRLMSLAGESLVQARWLHPFGTALQKLRKHQDHLVAALEHLAQVLASGPPDQLPGLVAEVRRQAGLCRQVLGERLSEFEDHAAQAEDLNSRLYHEVIGSRMRPFADGAGGFPRLVRDMARRLDKQVRLEILGPDTPVDRDVLERLEAPLTHLLRNSVDHGLEPPAERLAAGKPECGKVTLEVRHRAGALAITVADDGAGIDAARVARKVVERGLAPADMVGSMTEAELLDFLFLPGFSTAAAVTEYSGRGVGLDVVQDTLRKVGGSVRVTSRPGQGTAFHLLLPITLSVVRAVLVDVAGEVYAFPHNRIDRLVRVPPASVRSLENRQFVTVDGQNVGLVQAAQLFDLPARTPEGELSVLLVSDPTGQYGLIVDGFRGEQDLVVRPLDPRLGKVANISAAALLEDGSPVLIADVEDLIRSMDHFIQTGSLERVLARSQGPAARKRVLVVDDSITVRETERQLLRMHGYEVAVAVDGKEGWNVLQSEAFDLVVTDVDMPRMTGLDLVRKMRENERLREVPAIIVSYKDREEDRLRGLEVGANYYLTKSSFHDQTFLQAVADLIGAP
jgi:two-component system sensor histidine kinase and response regulator WspE